MKDTASETEASGTPVTGNEDGCKTSWSCPSSWTTGGSAPNDAPDAKAFIALNNVYRCMHNVQAVRWDADVYGSAKKWADHTQTYMSHSDGSWCPDSDGENLAGTFDFSKHRGVDATHDWYSEIEEYCSYGKSCYQSFTAGHFTAMIWSTVNKIAYADPTKELAVGRYRGCDGNPPNFNSAYRQHVPSPKNNYATCVSKVLACPAFSGLSANDLEGCNGGGAWATGRDWYMDYKKKCASKYSNIVSRASRLYAFPNGVLDRLLVSNSWPLPVAAGSTFVLLVAFAVKRAWRQQSPQFETLQDESFIEVERTGDGLE